MRTSGPGSSSASGAPRARGVSPRPLPAAVRTGWAPGGFSLIELLVVIALIAIAAGVMTLALRDPHAARLEQEGERLATLLEMARAESRVSGQTVRWWPRSADEGADPALQFRFGGLTASQPMPTRWLDPATRAEIVGAPFVLLGPEAILPPQRIVLWLADQRIELASDGLGAFAVGGPAAATAR